MFWVRGWIGAMLLAGGTACGPMPGYQVPHDEAPAAPRSPPAPMAQTGNQVPGSDLGRRTPTPPEPARPPARPAKPREEGKGFLNRQEREDMEDAEADEVEARDEDEGRDEPGRRWRDRFEPRDEEEPEVKPTPRPPRYTPQPNYDAPEPRKAVAPEPEPRREAIKIVRLDQDSYYLIDGARKLCFLRHKESMTGLDCAKLPEANDKTETPAPKAPARALPAPPEPPEADVEGEPGEDEPVRMPEPERMPEPTRMPEPSRMPEPKRNGGSKADEPARDAEPERERGDRDPKPSSPSPDELLRFESAFIDIYCDRKLKDDTAPEQRIREHGLTTPRYESIETWWANDENAWFTLTSKAAKSCK